MTPYVTFLAQSAAVSAFLVSLTASPAFAQTPAPGAQSITPAQSAFLSASFSQVVAGREIWITTSKGPRLKARVVGLAPTGLTVTDGTGQNQTIRFEDISRIEKATHRVRTHTFIGLGIGAGFGAIGAPFCDEGGCVATIIGVYAGIGAGIGAINGAIKNSLNKDDDLIYEAGARTTTTIMVAPILSRTKKGVAFTLSWR